MVKDFEKKQSHILQLDVLAQRPQSMRIEVTTPLGFHIARLALNEKTLTYILTRQREFYRGDAHPDSLKPILSVAVDPRWIVNLLFDMPPQGGGWDCDTREGLISGCKNSNLGISLNWLDRRKDSRKIQIITRAGEIQMDLKNYQEPGNLDPSVFELKKPPTFSGINLQKARAQSLQR